MDKFINIEEARAYAREHFPSPVKRRPIEEVLDNCPAVEIDLVPQGRWLPFTIETGIMEGCTAYECSECGRMVEDNGEPYCHCGAKMEAKDIDVPTTQKNEGDGS